VIFDQRVKSAYLRIVDAIGVECGIAKSLLSSNGLAIEFAKRTLFKGEDISPVPLTEFIAANLTLSDGIQFARKYKLSFPELVKSLGYGYRVLGNLNCHIGQLNSRIRALLFAYHLPQTEEEVNATLFQGNPLISKELLVKVVLEFKEILMVRYNQSILAHLKNLPSTPTFIKEVGEATMNTLLERLHFMEFLLAYLDKVEHNPDSLSTLIGPYDPKAQTGFTISSVKSDPNIPISLSGIPVSGPLFNRVQDLIYGYRLIVERIVKMLVNKPLSNFRAEASDLLWDIKGLRYQRNIFGVYTKAIGVMREISAIGNGKVSFERAPERPIRRGLNPVQMQY